VKKRASAAARKSRKRAPAGGKRTEEHEKEKDLGDLEERLGYAFQDRKFLRHALVHKSYVNERHMSRQAANERLEFLGDAVLELVVSHAIMDRFPEYTEGELSKLRASIVNEQKLARLAKRIGLGQFFFLGKGEARSGGREKASILADGYEAVLAAVYLDGGLPAAEVMVKTHFQSAIRKKPAESADRDFKTLLQEHCQAEHGIAPQYRLVETKGPDHRKEFTVELTIDGKRVSRGGGRTKKRAEQRAAALALKKVAGGGKSRQRPVQRAGGKR
jgi:ribonuclease-3